MLACGVAPGDLVLSRIFDRSGNWKDFGVLLCTANVEAQISSQRAQEATYRVSHSNALVKLEQMAVVWGRKLAAVARSPLW